MEAKDNFLGTSIAPKNRLENKGLPLFESFIIEEEEGSGGYGTVYRAMRKDDGKKFAIKCPHANAHRQHITNELKMLERFGGKNYVIKYEGSLKSGSNVCFILEHVPHDRPEVLKKEIDMYNLQWYGYCIFRALACLHKQGVMHRDVKPGNFLFSRKLNKGYLIDFNLALDLQQKHSIASKSKSSHHYASFEHVPVPQSKSASSSAKDEKFARSNTAISQVKAVDSKKNQEQDMNAKKTAHVGSLKNHPDPSGGNILRSQGADGSGITSTKDITSTRTHSRERMREPILCPVRKGFRSLVENVIQTSKHIKSPASQRKRVAALPSKADGKLLNPSPMPLHYGGLSITGAELLKSKENGKLKKEGSCVGTKGFRAPEVLFRSLHQGPKVDVWSAGVTLLYLMVGRSPFTGDPEQ